MYDLNYRNKIASNRSSIEDFYDNKTILITGATGFLGKILVEKLLRAFPNIKKIILIVRDKRGQTGEERIKDYFKDFVFSRLKTANVDYQSKVCGFAGDVLLDNLGLKFQDIQYIIDSVNVVFHAAATVNFKEELKKAIAINVKGTHEVAKLCHQMKHLQSFMYVSTAYSNCHYTTIEEKIYPHPIPPESLLKIGEMLDNKVLNAITPTLLGPWPNTYCYTKNAAENLLNSMGKGLPIGIFRPGIIISTIAEPFPAWVNKSIGSLIVVVSLGLGLLRVFHCHADYKSNVVPVDMVANGMIAAAWDVARQKEDKVKIFNYTSNDNPVSWHDYQHLSLKELHDTPFSKAVWCKTIFITPHYWVYKLMSYPLNQLPAIAMDLLAIMMGQEPRLKKQCDRLNVHYQELFYFSNREWKYETSNITKLWKSMSKHEQQLLYFDILSVNWDKTLSAAARGIKTYLFQEDMSENALVIARRNYMTLYWLHQAFKISAVAVGIKYSLIIFNKIYRHLRRLRT